MEMRTIIFNNVFNETSSVLNGTKTQMRCRACCGDGEISFCTDKGDGLLTVSHNGFDIAKANYKVGEVLQIGILQRLKEIEVYSDHVGDSKMIIMEPPERYCKKTIPFSIQITRVSIERLKDISDEECFKDGVFRIGEKYGYEFCNSIEGNLVFQEVVFESPREAFASKINEETGLNAWRSNPYMFVYDFKLIKYGTNEKR